MPCFNRNAGTTYLYFASILLRASRVADNQHVLRTKSFTAFIPGVLESILNEHDSRAYIQGNAGRAALFT